MALRRRGSLKKVVCVVLIALTFLLWLFGFGRSSGVRVVYNGSLTDDVEASSWNTFKTQHSNRLLAYITQLLSKPDFINPEQFYALKMRNFSHVPRCDCDANYGCGGVSTALLFTKLSNVEAGILPRCHPESQLLGPFLFTYNVSLDMRDVAASNPQVLPGGRWWPMKSQDPRCLHSPSLTSVAIIIPFRNRWRQLANLLSVLHPMLARQSRVCYQIFVVEQYGCQAFNKGRLNNAGVLEALADRQFDCVIFQDTDIVPEHDRNLYICPTDRPRHMAVAVDVHHYRLPYKALVGGVIAFTIPHYFKVNGYSNLYWGWGLEDDDMELRMKVGTKLLYSRPLATVARYKALTHIPQRIYRLQQARRQVLLSSVLRRFTRDGLNSVRYRVLLRRNEALYTHLLVDVGREPLDFELSGTE